MNDLVKTRLDNKTLRTPEMKKQYFREILQEIALYSLSVNGFFEKALFRGGTELRLIHSLPRFSEDLDFLLRSPDEGFSWERYESRITAAFQRFDLQPEIRRRKSTGGAIKAIMLLDTPDAVKDPSGRSGYTRIRLKIDTNPPAGAVAETGFLNFPIPHELSIMDLPSSFALKCHALLCRNWLKGRDWFDLLWFCSRNIHPNLQLFASSMKQSGPWEGQDIPMTEDWLLQKLREKTDIIDLKQAKLDVFPFVRAEERSAVENWSREMFHHFLTDLFEPE